MQFNYKSHQQTNCLFIKFTKGKLEMTNETVIFKLTFLKQNIQIKYRH